MKFSENWLRSIVDPALDSEALSHLLTMSGLEVEEVEAVAPAFEKVVVAEVLEVGKHPDADRLNVCRVNTGAAEPAQIVCGAPNVAAGMKVPCALPGAALPGGLKITVARVRGVESSGMLCSARELGLSEDHGGLLALAADAPVGADFRRHLDLDDRLLTLKLTPNRADCLSLTGIAREVAALTGAQARYPVVTQIAPGIDSRREVVLEAPDACPRYCGRVIRGVNARAATPEWMKRRIERSGIRSISALVDITNYVMLELGQPLHAFDDAKLNGAIRVRMPKPGEKLVLLNGQEIVPEPDVLLISDEVRALAMAGVMGGEESGISLDTRDLFLESAYFSPAAIAGRARRYGFSSDASHRYERGVDFDLGPRAMERATELVLAICGGETGPVVEACAELPARRPVRLRPARVERVLGIAFGENEIAHIFTRLGLDFVREGGDFLVTPPSYRFDIAIEEDLIEELARVHGYDAIPSPPPRGILSMLEARESRQPQGRLRQLLAARGYQETINFAFVEEAWEADFAGNGAPIRLANPIASQMGVMRSSLIGGLVGNLAHNLKRKQPRVRLFELGRCFSRNASGAPVAGFDQPWKLAGLAWGGALPEQWGAAARRADFYDVKGDVEFLLGSQELRFEAIADHPALHPGRAARLYAGERALGVVGELHPLWVQKYELGVAPVVFELDLAALLDVNMPRYVEVSRYPAVVRDLAVVVDQKLPLQNLLDALRAMRPEIVQDIQLFDVYAGKGVAEGKKSLAFRIVMQDTQKTLQDAEVDAAVASLTECLATRFGAQLRS